MRSSIVTALQLVPGKRVLRILDRNEGDRSFEWDPDDGGAVAVAEREFDDAIGNGMTGFGVKAGKETAVIKEFDPEADVIVVAPQYVGG